LSAHSFGEGWNAGTPSRAPSVARPVRSARLQATPPPIESDLAPYARATASSFRSSTSIAASWNEAHTSSVSLSSCGGP
jgi:hypothetical protein